jgi:hypothetical protein
MSYQSDINNAVAASSTLYGLIGNRFFWDIADDDATAPFLVAQTISTDGETCHDGTRDWEFPLIQFSAWAATKAESIEIGSAIKRDLEGVELMGASRVSLSYSGTNSTRDQETKLYGEIIDYRASTLTN